MSWQAKSAAPPAGYAYGPAYSPSWPNRLRAILYILAGRPRSLARDALLAMRDAPLPPLVRGQDNIPETGPFVMVANHYERPGLWMAWPALFLSTLVLARSGEDLHWIAIEEWESFSLWGTPIPPGATRAVFRRAFDTYGILGMAPAASPAAQRAASVRAALQEVRKGRVIGLMPEGDVGPTPELLPAREGVGAFLLLLAHAGAPVVPVGFYEEGGRLVARIGQPFALRAPEAVARQDRDRWAGAEAMRRIMDLLPQELWGVYRNA